MKPIFTAHSDDYIYPSLGITPLDTDSDLYLPLEVDTEYCQGFYHPHQKRPLNTTLTVQYRSVYESKGIIYAHPDIASYNPRHKVINHPLSVGNYLEDMGYKVNMMRINDNNSVKELRFLVVDLFTFFAVAELYRICLDDYIADIDYLCLQKDNKSGIEQARRLRTYTRHGTRYLDYVYLPWLWDICGINFRIALRIFDTSAVHGVTNYASFCSNSGVHLLYKDVFNRDDKESMDIMYFNRPDDFDNYALGDLYNHLALVGNSDNFKRIYQTLEIADYFTLPRLTVGSTVTRMIESCIKKLFNSSPTDRTVINQFCYFASAEYLKNKVGTTAALNAKVDGGRCRNNRPIEAFFKGVICDNDISGCYGEGLRAQQYPFGRPVVIDYQNESDRNDYLSLREFLNIYSDELVPGLWQARVSTKLGVTLKYSQDVLISWMPPKDIRKMPTDSEFAQTDEWWKIGNTGETKIFKNEVRYSLITHDFIQWLDNVASARQRKELLDNLQVITASIYPRSERVNSIDELIESHKNHKGLNTTFLSKEKKRIKKVSIERECYTWYSVNLGELLVDKLLLERKKYPKKTSFNELYKLCTNTVYGDMVSPYFKIGNVIVGNNITARARLLAWYMEKGFYGFQTITDGCQFDINRIAYPLGENRRLTGENVVDLYSVKTESRHITLKPLCYQDMIPDRWDLQILGDKPCLIVVSGDKEIYLDNAESLKVVALESFKHLQKQFPNVDILHQESTDINGNKRLGQFNFEVKNFYNCATFHGTANYSLLLETEDELTLKIAGGKLPQVYAMRSYSKHQHNKVIKSNDNLELISTDYTPSKEFLDSLINPENIKRSNVFIKRKILKIGDYKKNNNRWRETGVFPGMTIETASLLREFSLTQFTYQSWKQYESWRNEYQKMLKKYGQSYEMFFINDSGNLDYKNMIKVIDEKIRNGHNSFFEGIDKRSQHIYRLYEVHKELQTLNDTSHALFSRYLINNESDIYLEDTESENFYGDYE